MEIKWLGHASFKIAGSKNVYIDPWKLKDDEKADIILITHNHFDHFSPKDIQKIHKKETQVFGPVESLHGLKGKTTELGINKSVKIGDITVSTKPSYNTNKSFHPKVQKWLSFLVEMDGISIFHTGDSDVIKEFEDVKTDILLIPVSGHYVMSDEEAAAITNKIKPKLAIPMHWGDIIGERSNAQKFASLAKCEVKILKPGESFKYQ